MKKWFHGKDHCLMAVGLKIYVAMAVRPREKQICPETFENIHGLTAMATMLTWINPGLLVIAYH